MDWKQFGEKIKAARLEKGLTQQDVAKILEVTPESISYYEAGKKRPSFDKIKNLCRIYDIDMQKL